MPLWLYEDGKMNILLGLPNWKWSKALELDTLIASTVLKVMAKVDNTSPKTQRLWLEAAALSAAIVDKVNGGEVGEAEIIQEIMNALLLLGNTSQQQSLQQWKIVF